MSINVKHFGVLFSTLLLFSMVVQASNAALPSGMSANNDADARLETAVALLQGNDGTQADTVISLLQPLVEEGNAIAQVWLGRAYRDGLGGVAKDSKASFQLFEQAAGAKGLNPEAQLELGAAYMNGNGTDRNFISAYMWTALSASQSGPWNERAHQQMDILERKLTPPQQKTARILVEQMQSVYLASP